MVSQERGDEGRRLVPVADAKIEQCALGERATDVCNVVTELSRRHYVDDDDDNVDVGQE